MRSTPANAELALLLEVTGTPKPGNVDRRREYPALRFEHFVTGAVGARPGLDLAADATTPLGSAFETAIDGMAEQSGGNTQFGAVLLLTPLLRAAAMNVLDPGGVAAVVEDTTVADTVSFFEAFEHVDVAVDEPPSGMEPLDVRRGSDAASAIEERQLTWGELMARSADRDGVAAEWTNGFTRSFDAAARIREDEGPIADRASRVFLTLLAAEVDTFVVTQHDRETAEAVRERAIAIREGAADPDTVAEEFVDRGINPGTTADLVAAALFIALEGGLEI